MSRVRKVSVLILSWNGRRHLEECLPALREQQPPGCEWETLVLDNGSADGTSDWVREAHPEVRLLESPANLGFCAGNNHLVAEARGDALVFLNNDTRPRRDWLAALTGALDGAPEDVAAVSGLIVDWPGERLDFASGIMTFDGHAFQLGQGRPLAGAELPTAGSEMLFACGGNMIIRRESFLGAGSFDPDYFA
ncbi:MAG: glycosyltransferase family 2 protein, partial [Thermoanaerobaculia bacterium]